MSHAPQRPGSRSAGPLMEGRRRCLSNGLLVMDDVTLYRSMVAFCRHERTCSGLLRCPISCMTSTPRQEARLPKWVKRYRWFAAGPHSKSALARKPTRFQCLIRWPMLLALCNRAEEYSHAGSSECDPRAQASAVEQGQAHGAKPPLRPKHVWSSRTKLQIEGRARDLAMFNLAIDSKLRGCDVVAIRVEDVALGGYTADRATIRQKKTGRPVRFEMSEQTRQAVDDFLKATGKRPGEFLFTGRRGPDRNMTTRQYAWLVSEWIGSVGLDPRLFGTHSLRRTKATLIYRRTGNLRAVQLLLGHTKIESTVRYLGIEVDDALAIAEQVDV